MILLFELCSHSIRFDQSVCINHTLFVSFGLRFRFCRYTHCNNGSDEDHEHLHPLPLHGSTKAAHPICTTIPQVVGELTTTNAIAHAGPGRDGEVHEDGCTGAGGFGAHH